MATLKSSEGSSSSSRDASGESSESTLQINIKTLDSRVFSFDVDKTIGVLAFKEKIASQIDVPVGQQRLIFRGKVLKDDHLLSEYNVENGDTLHVVERQPQPAPGSNTVEATSNNGNRGGQDSTAGGPRRTGQIAHSVVLGTLNVGDPGEAVVPDLSRVIGAVLNSIGIGNLAGGMPPGFQPSPGNETEGSEVNSGNRSQGGSQSVPSPYPMQTPIGAAIAVPSLNLPIPDSLNTLTEFMNRMESAFSQNGTQENQAPTASNSLPTPQLPTNSRGSTVEALTIVLQHAQRLLCDHAVPALSHIAGRLEQDGDSDDPAVRGQVHSESMHLGVSMQHLGSLLLELGRTIMTLRLGQSPGESFVNAGPAVYISPSGPNPIMVQPFPLQTSSLFGDSPGVAPSPVSMNPLAGNIPRNVNIHIHTGAALAPIVSTLGNRAPDGEEMQRERVNRNESGDQSGQARVSSGVNVIASRPAVIPISGAVPVVGVPEASNPNAISSIVAEIDRQIRSITDNRQNEYHTPSEGLADRELPVGLGSRQDDVSSHQSNPLSSRAGETIQTLPCNTIVDDQKAQTDCSSSSKEGPHHRSTESEYAESREGPSRSSQGNDNPDESSGVPVGLGLGGLQPKRRVRHPRAQARDNDGANSSSSREVGQQVLQSLASISRRGDANPPSLGQPSNFARGTIGTAPTASQNTDGHVDAADAMSHILQNPSLDGLLAGVSQQTGVGSPDMLRNMLQQFTQNPAMRNTVNQIAQQIDTHDLGSMFTGLDNRGQGGGIDLSRMMQQMMPIVSQALGGVSSLSQLNPHSEPGLMQSSSRRDITPVNYDTQINLQQVVQSLEDRSSPQEIFRSLVDTALYLSDGSPEESTVNELSSQGGLAQEFMEMLCLDLSRRLQDARG